MLIWTQRDDDTVEQCKRAMDNCRQYHCNPSPWFGLCMRMYKELESNGLLKRVEVKQVICQGCIWASEGGGCQQHFDGANMDTVTGEVRFCPRKTTQQMRDAQLKLMNRKEKRA